MTLKQYRVAAGRSVKGMGKKRGERREAESRLRVRGRHGGTECWIAGHGRGSKWHSRGCGWR